MLCLSGRIDILSWAEAEFELDTHILSFSHHCFLLSFLEIDFPFLYTPSAAALLRAPGLTLPARPARWRPGSCAPYHSTPAAAPTTPAPSLHHVEVSDSPRPCLAPRSRLCARPSMASESLPVPCCPRAHPGPRASQYSARDSLPALRAFVLPARRARLALSLWGPASPPDPLFPPSPRSLLGWVWIVVSRRACIS